MALISPVHAAIVPFLCIVTVPLAIFAGLTTTLAFAVLICRVVIVYLDIAVQVLHNSFGGLKVPSHLQQATSRPNSRPPSRVSSFAALRRRRRRPSSVSILTGGTVTPDAGLGLTPSIGPNRDYEGVGGWRTGDDDDIWTTINSRLELPDRHTRHHHRSPSGPTTPGDGGFLMMKRRNRSPEEAAAAKGLTSPRARTPSASRSAFSPSGHNDGYFPLTMSSKSSTKKLSPPMH